ncbi:MAG: arsenic efflux protein [Blautia sp.]|nr:arsenic efflux protein [Blautia sp.]MCM1199900.1 arsenic efflux protein [Bacteroides fragilis]
MLDIILDTLSDSIKLLPFLFLTYLIMEYLEHRAGSRMQNAVQKSGGWGPVIGGVLGAFPQCGFSAAASNLYAGRVITLGTLLSIYLSTSDEMLPVLISENAGIGMILKITCAKILIGMTAGLIIDAAGRLRRKEAEELRIERLCERHHCHCENGILKSALHHTAEIFLYLLLISFILNMLLGVIGEDFLANLLLNRPVIGELAAGLIGMIPNCAASVVITQLYLKGILNAGAMMSGLLSGAGAGVLVLLRVNDRRKENAGILALLYGVGVLTGLIVELLGIWF